MEEVYEITEHTGFELITCSKRKLTIQVIHTDRIPENLPDNARIAFATLYPGIKAMGQKLEMEILTAFCIIDPEKIEYESYFIHPVLIANAIHYYFAQLFKCGYDKIEYSPAYQRDFIDTMSLEPEKMSFDLLAYMSRDVSEEPLDFYAWKEKHMKTLLN